MKIVRKKSRPRNQRVSNGRQRRQQHLLDVKVRSRSATQYRNRRILVVVSKLALLAAVCGGLYLGLRQSAKHFFFDNPDYRLSEIDVQTDGSLQREQILRTANLHEGENIFRVNLAEVHDLLQQLPQVDEVEVVRKLPSEIDIKLVERRPIAWITRENEISDPFASEGAFLMDARGVLMKEKKLLPEYLGLPLILGCTSESLEAGKVVESYEAKAALELLRLSAGSFMQTRFQIREIDLSKGYCIVITDKNHTRVTFPFENLDAELQRLEQFLVYCDDSKQELATAEVINETIDPAEERRVMKAIPVDQPPKAGTSSAVKPHPGESPPSVKRAIPVKGKKKKNGE